jgi:probable rRNA maturation factor
LSGSLFIKTRPRVTPVNAGYLRRLTRALLRDCLGREDFDLGIYLVRAPEMTRLNEAFLRHKGSTDVITFDYADKVRTGRPRPAGSGVMSASSPALHGEIFVCIDEAVAQSRRFRTTWQSELARYVIHGLLHLLGHDDLRPSDRRKMKRVENRLLKDIARRFPLRKLARNPRLAA